METQLTMSMYSHAAGTNVSGDREVREPQVLDVDVPEGGADGRVELPPGEHRRGWVRQVEELFAPLGHFLGRC